MLGQGFASGPDLAEIQRVSKEISVKRAELLAKGKDGAPLNISPQAKYGLGIGGGVAVVGMGYLISAVAKNEAIKELNSQNSEQFNSLEEKGRQHLIVSYVFTGIGVPILAYGVKSIF